MCFVHVCACVYMCFVHVCTCVLCMCVNVFCACVYMCFVHVCECGSSEEWQSERFEKHVLWELRISMLKNKFWLEMIVQWASGSVVLISWTTCTSFMVWINMMWWALDARDWYSLQSEWVRKLSICAWVHMCVRGCDNKVLGNVHVWRCDVGGCDNGWCDDGDVMMVDVMADDGWCDDGDVMMKMWWWKMWWWMMWWWRCDDGWCDDVMVEKWWWEDVMMDDVMMDDVMVEMWWWEDVMMVMWWRMMWWWRCDDGRCDDGWCDVGGCNDEDVMMEMWWWVMWDVREGMRWGVDWHTLLLGLATLFCSFPSPSCYLQWLLLCFLPTSFSIPWSNYEPETVREKLKWGEFGVIIGMGII